MSTITILLNTEQKPRKKNEPVLHTPWTSPELQRQWCNAIRKTLKTPEAQELLGNSATLNSVSNQAITIHRTLRGGEDLDTVQGDQLIEMFSKLAYTGPNFQNVTDTKDIKYTGPEAYDYI